MNVGVMTCATDFHDLCLQLSPQESLGESRKVSVMEYGLKTAKQLIPSFGVLRQRR